MKIEKMMTYEYIFCKNKYNLPVFYKRRKGTTKYDYGYPYSVDGLVELERGECEGGRHIVRVFHQLCKKYNLQNHEITSNEH